MSSIGRDLSDVDSLLVTHEHSDHCKGVGVLARKYHLDVYANEGTWNAMAHKIGKIPLAKSISLKWGGKQSRLAILILKALAYRMMLLSRNFMSFIITGIPL